MHATKRKWALTAALALASGPMMAQPPADKPAPAPASAPKAAPAPGVDAAPKTAPIQGKQLSGEAFEKVPRNTVEVFSVAPKRLVPPAPRSTNDQVVQVQLVRPPGEQKDKLPDSFRISTTDLIGAATIYYSTIDEAGKIEQKSVEFLVVDEISEALQGYLESTIRKTYPTVTVGVLVPNSQTAVLTGYVDRAELVEPIQQLVRGFLAARTGAPPDTVQVVNSIRVTGVQQVQLKVIIAEVNRTKLRALGLDYTWTDLTGLKWVKSFNSSVGTASVAQLATAVAGATSIVPVQAFSSDLTGANAPFVVGTGTYQFAGLLKFLTSNVLGKILAEPILVTTSGQPAFFNSGGEVPVLIPQGFGTISIQYKPFGTNLSFVPTVLGEGRIRLEVRPEVSERSNANGVFVQGSLIPGFVTRVAETTVELENGQSFAIAGLMQSRITATGVKTPFIGDIPLIGWAFQQKLYQQQDSELLIIVTPHLVEPMDERVCKLPGRESRVPNAQEFFWGSKFEPPCFDDPYRNHWQKHFKEEPVQPPAAVPPYDNFGRPQWTGAPMASGAAAAPTATRKGRKNQAPVAANAPVESEETSRQAVPPAPTIPAAAPIDQPSVAVVPPTPKAVVMPPAPLTKAVSDTDEEIPLVEEEDGDGWKAKGKDGE